MGSLLVCIITVLQFSWLFKSFPTSYILWSSSVWDFSTYCRCISPFCRRFASAGAWSAAQRGVRYRRQSIAACGFLFRFFIGLPFSKTFCYLVRLLSCSVVAWYFSRPLSWTSLRRSCFRGSNIWSLSVLDYLVAVVHLQASSSAGWTRDSEENLCRQRLHHSTCSSGLLASFDVHFAVCHDEIGRTTPFHSDEHFFSRVDM